MAADNWMEESAPDSLWEITLTYCCRHLESFTQYDSAHDCYVLREGITLPAQFCESFLRAFPRNSSPLEDKHAYIFKDTEHAHLKRIYLRNARISDNAIRWLMQHKPMELDMSDCTSPDSDSLTIDTIHVINENGRNLVALYLGTTHDVFRGIEMRESGDDRGKKVWGGDYVFDCPNLRAFSVHGLHDDEYQAHDLIATILHPFSVLTYLDLSLCEIEIEFMDCLGEMQSLTTLILYDVPINNIKGAFQIIGKLTNLRMLDIGQSRDGPVAYSDPEKNLAYLVGQLPYLQKLDLSGTNLAGFEKPTQLSHRPPDKPWTEVMEEEKCSIPGLEGRKFEFLGLLGCSHDACRRENIPATHVTGDATEEQVILSVKTYIDRPQLLVKSLNHLFHIFRFSECVKQWDALRGILGAMTRHPHDKQVQISGSASLFYIVKEKKIHNSKLKRGIIAAILDGMDFHMDEATMMRNGCLTLCHFRIPEDVRFEYERMVRILLRMVAPPEQEGFVQRIGIYLLNSLACQVDGQEKLLVGNLGAIDTMLAIIANRLDEKNCDEVMEIAWSTMWNVTDETAENCARFIRAKGMDAFLRCLEVFPNKPELLRNMMGLMGNVAEVKHLRQELMKPEYVTVFSDLLDSTSDGIEVSYNACGVLAHLVSDGESAWGITQPSRQHTLDRMVSAINRWNIRTTRNINYRSFEPIMRLVPQFDTPQAQHWAIWALCNLTTMYPKKYCPLVEKERGLIVLQEVVQSPRPYQTIHMLANQVIETCRRFKENPDEVEEESIVLHQYPDGAGDAVE